jgi:hypothetical protein
MRRFISVDHDRVKRFGLYLVGAIFIAMLPKIVGIVVAVAWKSFVIWGSKSSIRAPDGDSQANEGGTPS